jgi:hypothetical protein
MDSPGPSRQRRGSRSSYTPSGSPTGRLSEDDLVVYPRSDSPPGYAEDDFPPRSHRRNDGYRDTLLDGAILKDPPDELEPDLLQRTNSFEDMSTAERKATWWKNVLITGMFVLGWLV